MNDLINDILKSKISIFVFERNKKTIFEGLEKVLSPYEVDLKHGSGIDNKNAYDIFIVSLEGMSNKEKLKILSKINYNNPNAKIFIIGNLNNSIFNYQNISNCDNKGSFDYNKIISSIEDLNKTKDKIANLSSKISRL